MGIVWNVYPMIRTPIEQRDRRWLTDARLAKVIGAQFWAMAMPHTRTGAAH